MRSYPFKLQFWSVVVLTLGMLPTLYYVFCAKLKFIK
jgi:hypothetical protein